MKVELTEIEMRERIRRYVDTIGTQKEATAFFEISPQYLNDILQEQRKVPKHVAAKLGFELKRRWVKI